MQQKSFFQRQICEHGGSLSKNKRRKIRPLSTKRPIHFTLRSELAKGPRSLLKHRKLIDQIQKKFARYFNVRVYKYAVCSNHLHFLIRGKNRTQIQNFFRVLAGHISQKITKKYPISDLERQGAGGALINSKTGKLQHKKNQRKFWSLLIYTRILTWGREYKIVLNYIIKNTLEALNIVAYTPRRTKLNTNTA